MHLAVMLGRKECILLLLAHGAVIKVKNVTGWTPLSEAISYGDRHTISSLLRKLKQQAREKMEERRPHWVAALREMGDFYMELKWDFQSWVPLSSKFLPSDVCRIHKSGASIRVDTTLVDLNDIPWERGDISFIFNGDQKPGKSITVLDNINKLYQTVRYEETDMEIEDEVDILMSSDIMVMQMSTKGITFTKAQSGLIFREDKRKMVGPFQADFYHVNGVVLRSKKRREHLSEEDLRKNKATMESLNEGILDGSSNGEHHQQQQQQLARRRASLHPPPRSTVSWEEYASAAPGEAPCLGRRLIYKETRKSYKATLAMSQEFPLTIEMLLNLLEVVSPLKHFNKLKKFVLMKLPPGFPVKLDIPLLPVISAKITFQEFAFRSTIDPDLFQVPADYVEDPNRFPDL